MSRSQELPDPDGCPETERLRAALREGNIPTLLMVLVHLTGDRRWLAAPYAPTHAKGLDDNDSGGLSDKIQDEIRAATLDAVIRHRAGLLPEATPTPDEVAEMLGVALAEEVPKEYGVLLAEELGTRSRDIPIVLPAAGSPIEALIIGFGLSGICAAIKLKAAGIPFTILEKNSDLGGTWLENTYPGVGVDTPSHLYSFSFAKNANWSRYFARGGEVHGYLHELVEAHGLRDHVRFDTEVVTARYDSGSATWSVAATDTNGPVTYRATVLISAVGMVNRPARPRIPGLDDFEGAVQHTAQWTDIDLRGKDVAVVGTGASAMQLAPSIAADVRRLTIYQRSIQWAVPHPNYQREVSPAVRLLFQELPFYLDWYRLRAFWNFSDRLHSSIQIDDGWPYPERSINAVNERHRVFLTGYITRELGDRTDLIDVSVPSYPPYGKRPLIDNGWYRMLRRDNVELVPDGVSSVTPRGVVSGSGVERPADVIVLATGFKAIQMLYPMDIRGRSGRSLRGETWEKDDARALLGMTVPDFPNFFIINGPNTNAGHGGSAIHATEFQVRYIMQALRHMIEKQVAELEVKETAYRDYNAELDEALSHSVWSHPGMSTYYRNDSGRIVVSSPWTYLDYWDRTRQFEPDDFIATLDRAAVAEAVG